MPFIDDIIFRGSYNLVRKEDGLFILPDLTAREQKNIMCELFSVHFNNDFLQPFIVGQGENIEFYEKVFRVSSEEEWISKFRTLACAEHVIVSDITPSYYDKQQKTHQGKQDDLSQYPLLGEYMPDGKYVYLYYYNILKCAEQDRIGVLSVLRYVYLHELMHKYFDRDVGHKYNMEEEEALAEFGALLCLECMVENGRADKIELDWAINHVKSKDGPLKHYAYGETLYQQYKVGNTELKERLIKY